MHTRFNEDSWLKMIAFAESFPDPVWTDWRAQMVPLLREALERGIHHHFQAGQSMQHIIFSTLEHWGLDREPRVTIGYEKDMSLFVAYSTTNIWFSEPMTKVALQRDNAMNVLARFLRTLWTDTKPDAHVPAELAEHN